MGRHGAQDTYSGMALRLLFCFCLFLKRFDSGMPLRFMHQRDCLVTWKLILL